MYKIILFYLFILNVLNKNIKSSSVFDFNLIEFVKIGGLIKSNGKLIINDICEMSTDLYCGYSITKQSDWVEYLKHNGIKLIIECPQVNITLNANLDNKYFGCSINTHIGEKYSDFIELPFKDYTWVIYLLIGVIIISIIAIIIVAWCYLKNKKNNDNESESEDEIHTNLL